MEAEDRAAEQAVEDLLAPRTDAEYLGVWPRYVPEGDDDRLGQLLADQPWQQREMIVLDEDDRALGLGLLKNDLGELAVDGLVAFPVGGPEDGPCEGDVAERPEAFVGEARIITLVFLLGEPYAPKRIGGAGGRYGYAVIRIDHVHIGRAAAMRDPGSSTSARDGLERRNQPARRHLQLDAAAHALMHIRLAVGYDDEVSVGQFRLEDVAQHLGRPLHKRILCRRQTLCLAQGCRGCAHGFALPGAADRLSDGQSEGEC